ncbi:MAG: hypothetical protein ACPL4K_06300, partial [Candidatus Margulisiibacteriota bacterium]
LAQAEFHRHHRALNIIFDSSQSSLFTTAAEIYQNIRLIAKQAVFKALWEVCKKASDYSENALAEIEVLATKYFHVAISEIESSRHGSRIELVIPSDKRDHLIKISESDSGFVLADVTFPEGSRVMITSQDSNTRISASLENTAILVDSRYFLLAQKMEEFRAGIGDIIGIWTALEYSRVLTDLILAEKVTLNRSRTALAFEAAWSIKELEIFGSTDYLKTEADLTTIAIDLLNGPGKKLIVCRENIYELLPPTPLRKTPGISVYRDLKVKNVDYRRQDPAGLLGLPTATPIPLGTSGATIWWGQWEVTIETEESPVEEIFDFDNPNIPRPCGDFCAHLPLAYRWKFSEKEFKTIITIFSPRPFMIFVQ